MTSVRTPVPLEAPISRRRSNLLGPFGYRDFRLLWWGLIVSNLGTWMQFTTLGYLVVVFAGTPARAALDVGILGVSAAVPVVLLSPLAGFVADRYPRRVVLLYTNGSQIAVALCLALLSTFHVLNLVEIYVLSSLRSTTQAFDAPARQSWAPLLVPRELLGNAIGLNSIAFNAPSVAGPPLAGILILYVGVSISFYVNAVATFAVVIALLLMTPAPPSSKSHEGPFASIVAGLRFMVNHAVLRSVVALLIVTCVFVRPYSQLLPAYALHVVHADARGLGMLLAASGIGAIGGSILTAVVGARRRGWVWFSSALVMALGVIVLGFVREFWVAVPVLCAIGCATLSFAGSTNVLLQTLSPDDMRGRAISVFSMVILGLVPAGSLLVGSFASLVTLPVAFMCSGAFAAVISTAVFAGNPALRRV